jgi:sulfite reductase beta subunit-like hemoprotein
MEPVSAPPRKTEPPPETEVPVKKPELDEDHGKKQHGKGRLGSLENPEAYENVPGHVIPILEREFDDFDTEAGKFMRGEKSEEEFIGFRLKQGVYGQRQPNVQMIRTKLPYGGINPEQMEAFADVIERYTPLRKGHITTRQNIQIHHVPLDDAAKAIRELGDAGLSSREGCGNTVRNVTGDPYAGLLGDETFDPTPYAGAYVRYFVRHPTTQLMPRKWKTAFSSSDADRAITPIHDLGFIPRIREGVRGFKITVGGGTSIMPRIAETITEFAQADSGEYLKISEAALRIFDRQDWLRANRARARIKVLIDKIGIEEFRRRIDEELEGDWVSQRDFEGAVERGRFVDDEEANAPPVPPTHSSPNGDRSRFDRFLEGNVTPQRQPGFSAVEVKVTRGDLTPEHLRGLAAIMRHFTGGYARTSAEHQNFVLRWVRDEALYDVWTRLVDLGLGDPGAQEITDVVSCPGTDSCKLGITSSMGLNEAIQQRLDSMRIEDPLSRRINIKMSGCPNGCGQHHIGSIGFYGASLKVGGRQMPAYIPHLGGRSRADATFGKRLKSRLPAKRVPDAVERWLRFYEEERSDGEAFADFVERIGPEEFEKRVEDLAMPAEFNLENMLQFVDWARSEPYKVERGEGECAV